MLWLTRQLRVKIAGQTLFLMKVNRHSIKRRDLKMNPRDVLLAEEKENNKEIEDRVEIDTNTEFISSIKVDSMISTFIYM